MIPRTCLPTLERLAKGFPILALTGPRQSGKTTLARYAFPDKPYVSLENLDEREFAERDPRRFLARFDLGAVIDEAQRCPSLFSWLQGEVDERRRMGEFILTGSAQFDLLAGISQSLAGRVGRIELLPLSAAEINAVGRLPDDLDTVLLTGGYPALFDRPLAGNDWFPNYVATYVERDARQLLAIRDLSLFQRFLRLCAARSGQLLNLAALAADCGIAAVTAREWLDVLEASYLVMRLPPYHRNFGKRLVKTPKLYFLDTGLLTWLLGIREATTLALHPMRGAIFETWVVSEFAKQRFNLGQPAQLYFWRDNVGHEIDLLYETPLGLQAVEIKSGATFAPDWFDACNTWCRFAGAQAHRPIVVYGGDSGYSRDCGDVHGWRDVAA